LEVAANYNSLKATMKLTIPVEVTRQGRATAFNHFTRTILSFLIIVCAVGTAGAEDPVWTTGKVLGPDGKPVAGAIVAAYDDSNKVVDYARTDKNGEYALAVPKRALHIDKHGQTFFASVFGSAERFGGSTVGFVTDPLRAGVRAVTSAEAANYADPVTKGTVTAGGVVADQMLGMLTPPRHRTLRPKAERIQPGVVMMKVISPQSNDMIDIDRVYWMQEEELRAGGKSKKTIAAWLDPVKLAPAGSDSASKVEAQYLKFTHVRISPSVAERGQIVHVSTKLIIPPDPHVDVVVVARNAKTGEMWELHPGDGDTFETDVTVDKKFANDDQSIEIIAYAALRDKPGRRSDVEHAIDRSGMWDPLKPYVYNPLLVVSRNRGEATLTIVQVAKRKK
jgi:hypothetical protein